MKGFIARRLGSFFVLALLVGSGFFSAAWGQGFDLIRYDSFEEYTTGTSTLDYWHEQNCGAGPSCGSTCVDEPLMVTDEQARSGEKALRFQRTDDDKVLTGGSYCSARNEIANWNDAFSTYGDHVWFGFSVYIADNHLEDQWSANNVTIFQFKNIDAGGGGNSYGSLKSYKKDGVFKWYMYGYGDVGNVVINEWVDVVIHLKYGIDNDGMIEAWIGDDYIYLDKVSFPAKLACYPKFGSYSDILGPDSPMHKIYFDEIKFGKASDGGDYFDEVVPAFVCQETTVPIAPEDFSGLASGVKEISLTWADKSDKEKGFNMERKREGEEYAFLAQIPSDATNYTDKGVEDGHNYWYRLAAYNCFGTSSYRETQVYIEEDHTQLISIESVLANRYLASYKPENAVDGKMNTYWLIDGENEWLELKLSEPSTIARVAVSFINGDSRKYKFHIDVSNNGDIWNRTKTLWSSGEENALENYSLEDVSCEYLRFITGENTVDDLTWLAEIQLWGSLTSKVIEPTTQEIFQIYQSQIGSHLEITVNEGSFYPGILIIYNMLGRMIGSYEVTSNRLSINGAHFIPGVYFVVLKKGSRSVVQKVQIM